MSMELHALQLSFAVVFHPYFVFLFSIFYLSCLRLNAKSFYLISYEEEVSLGIKFESQSYKEVGLLCFGGS